MKKKVYILCIFLIIISSLTNHMVFDAYKQSEDFREAQNEIDFLEDIILNKKIDYEEGNLFEEVLEEYSRVLNANIKVLYKDGSVVDINNKDEEVVYNKSIKGDMENLEFIKISLYKEKANNDYIRNLFSAMIISIIIALFFVSRFTEDEDEIYGKLNQVMNKNIEGKYEKLELNRKDEKTVLLQNNFNSMTDVIRDKELEYQDLNTKLKSIINSMKEGILAVDLEGDIILTNLFAEYILGSEGSKSIYSIKNKGIYGELFAEGLEDSKDIYIEHPAAKKIRVSKNPIKYYRYSNRKIGNLYIFEDITQVDKLENMRADFVANVSHELKTPLTSIIGYIETLENGGLEDRDFLIKSMNIIGEEVIRMNNLIDDLLFLSEIETMDREINKERIDLVGLLEDIFELFKIESLNRSVKLEKNVLEEELFIYENEKYIRQVLINLISNGIKYNLDGGYVCVTISKDYNYIFIDVLDNGIGMSEEDKDHVFERFYRIDKSRSNKIKGTGLGLSIVKHIVSLLNGQISIESSKNIGTLVSIKIRNS